MLRQPDSSRAPANPRPDAIATLTVAILAACAVGMLLAGILAVYDYTTPSVEAPLALGLAIAFGAAVALNVVASAVRHFRPS